jgi:hypothetical protein
VTDKQNKWSQWLQLAEWWYNSTYHTSPKMTPFQALYGYEPPKWKEFALIDTKVQAVKNQLEEEQKIIYYSFINQLSIQTYFVFH